jgi:hypothetical protein
MTSLTGVGHDIELRVACWWRVALATSSLIHIWTCRRCWLFLCLVDNIVRLTLHLSCDEEALFD